MLTPSGGDTVAPGIVGLRGTRGYGRGVDGLEETVDCLVVSDAPKVNLKEEDPGVSNAGCDASTGFSSLSSGDFLREKVEDGEKESGDSGSREGKSFKLGKTGDDVDTGVGVVPFGMLEVVPTSEQLVMNTKLAAGHTGHPCRGIGSDKRRGFR